MLQVELVTAVLIGALLAFYVWMFLDLTRNDRLPPQVKTTWAFAFLVLNIFAAGAYYLTEYRRGG